MSSFSGHLALKYNNNGGTSNAPMLRRSSATESVLSVDLLGSQDVSSCEALSDDSNSLISSFSSRIFSIKKHGSQTGDDFVEKLEEESLCEKEQHEKEQCKLQRAQAQCQHRHVIRNTKMLLMDDDNFHTFQQVVKKTGVLTTDGVKQVLLSPIVDKERQLASRKRNSCVNEAA